MVERAADAYGEIHLWSDGAAADTHLNVMGKPARVHDVAGGADGRADAGSQLLSRRDALFADAHAEAHDDFSGCEFQRPVLFGDVLTDEGDVDVVGGRRLDGLDDGGCAGFGRAGRQHAGTEGDQVGKGLREDGRDDVAAEGRLELHQLAGVVDLEVDGVTGEAEPAAGGDAGGQVAAIGGGGEQDGVGWLIADCVGERA